MADNEQQPPISPTDGMSMPSENMDDASLGEQVSAVAERSGKKTVLMVVGGLIVVYMLYGFLFKEKPPTPEEIAKIAEEKKGSVAGASGLTLPSDQGVAEVPPAPLQVPEPPLPPLPELPPAPTAPTPLVPAPGRMGTSMVPMPPGFQQGAGGALTAPSLSGGGAPQVNFSEAEKAKVRANSMFQAGSGRFQGDQEGTGISNGSGGGASSGGAAGDGTGTEEAEKQSSVSEVGDPNLMVAQGKIISAVLETAINTDLPGALRAVVSRDVYAEQGKNVVIPRGSRLIGSYNTDIKRGQARIYIVWNRLIMPSGHDLQLGSPSTDLLGRSGIEGHVDNKYFELFSNSLLLSSLSVGFAAAVGSVTDSQSISQGETGSGDATTSGNVVDIATLDAVKDFSEQVQDVVQDLVQVAPTITVNQGTRVKIFVNRDLFFPEELTFILGSTTDEEIPVVSAKAVSAAKPQR